MTKSRKVILAGSLGAVVLVACLLLGAAGAGATGAVSPALKGPAGDWLTSEPLAIPGMSCTEKLHGRTCSFTLPYGVDLGSVSDTPGAIKLGAVTFGDGFESGITQWTRTGSPTWGRTTYRAASGSYSAYCVGSGYSPPGPYPNGSDSLMLAGPFDLSGLSSAVFEYDLYLNTELDWDWCFAVVSANGVDLDGIGFSGESEGWEHKGLDLSAVPTDAGYVSMLGDSSVWVGFWFVSDPWENRDEGAYVDNVEIVTEALPPAPPTITGLSTDFGSTSGGKTVVITGTNFVGLTGEDAVTFGGTNALSYTHDSATQITATAPPHDPGLVQVQVKAAGGTTTDTAADDFTYVDAVVTYTSIRGTDRFDTALKLSQAMFPAALPPDSGVVLAPGWESYQEALCGAPLAAAWGGPVLLSSKTVLYSGVAAELTRLDPDHVFCIGLTGTTVADGVRALLPGAAVTSINGVLDNVYHMSYLVANALGSRVDAKGGDISSATGIVTVGYNFPDAIGVSPLACYKKWPVLLTDHGGNDPMNAHAVQAMNELGITTYVKAGTYAPDPDGITGVGNCSGADRYYTNAGVAVWAQAHAGLTYAHTALTTGDKFPDALAGGPYVALDHGMLLLSPLLGPLPAPISNLISANQAEVQHVTFIACIEPVIGQAKALLP
ncbi:MAG: cell wall-binding repeat-containing protein [Thermoleophilia bacterium]|nr:cell wall-binding repeat-containing protein [Thermoleophilia bacterium]